VTGGEPKTSFPENEGVARHERENLPEIPTAFPRREYLKGRGNGRRLPARLGEVPNPPFGARHGGTWVLGKREKAREIRLARRASRRVITRPCWSHWGKEDFLDASNSPEKTFRSGERGRLASIRKRIGGGRVRALRSTGRGKGRSWTLRSIYWRG